MHRKVLSEVILQQLMCNQNAKRDVRFISLPLIFVCTKKGFYSVLAQLTKSCDRSKRQSSVRLYSIAKYWNRFKFTANCRLVMNSRQRSCAVCALQCIVQVQFVALYCKMKMLQCRIEVLPSSVGGCVAVLAGQPGVIRCHLCQPTLELASLLNTSYDQTVTITIIIIAVFMER